MGDNYLFLHRCATSDAREARRRKTLGKYEVGSQTRNIQKYTSNGNYIVSI